MPIEAPFLDGKGELATPSVLAQIDARTKATMRADLPALADELGIGGALTPEDEAAITAAADRAEAAAASLEGLKAAVDETVAQSPADSAVAAVLRQDGTQAREAVYEVVRRASTPADTNLAAYAAQAVEAPIDVPAGVGLTIPLAVLRTPDGYQTNVNPAALHTRRAGPTYYVDPVSGSNTNDGLTPATAFKTPFYASQRNGNDWAEIVITRSATFDRAEGVFLMQAGGTVRAAEGEEVNIICGDRLTTWAANGTAYGASIATCNGVIDAGYLDAYGDPTPLRSVSTVAEVQATPGTYHYAGGTVTVRLHDSRVPDSNVHVGRTVAGTGWHANATGDNVTVYLEGIHWWGGTTTANFTAKGNGWKVLAKDCGFHAAGSGNGITPWGCETVIFQGCSANHNYLDGFNYTDNAGRTGQFVEIDCRARNNGRTGGSNNGSTSHDNYRGARVGGVYIRNEGANVADVGNTRTANIGCQAAGSTSYRQDFYTNQTAKMWVDGCVGASRDALTALDSATLYRRDTVAAGAVVGNVITY